MDATPTAAAHTAQPAPSRDRLAAEGFADTGAGIDAGTAVGRLLVLVRWIISYSQELAADTGRLAALTFRFQTSDLAAIVARIARGLMLAGAVEARLAQLAAAGRDVQPAPFRMPSTRGTRDPKAATASRPHHTNIIDLDRLPTAEEAAAEVRRRPLGAVLADICRLLCILPGDFTPERGQELTDAVMIHGGSLITAVRFPSYEKAVAQARRRIAGGPPDDADWVLPDRRSAVAATPTGPPDGARKPVGV